MASYVLLGGAPKGNSQRIVVHTDVPAGTNQAGVSWGDALVGYLGDTTSVVPLSILPAGRQTDLDSGNLRGIPPANAGPGRVGSSAVRPSEDRLARVHEIPPLELSCPMGDHLSFSRQL